MFDAVGVTPFAPAAVFYGAVDNFYPGGWQKVGKEIITPDASRLGYVNGVPGCPETGNRLCRVGA